MNLADIALTTRDLMCLALGILAGCVATAFCCLIATIGPEDVDDGWSDHG